jgi:hypothetical protein
MMTDLTSNEIDEVMSGIGMRVANEAVGKPLDDDNVDDILVKALRKASEAQLYEVVDNMIDLLSISEIMNQALSDDGLLDAEELDELMEYLTELEDDTKILMKDLITNL